MKQQIITKKNVQALALGKHVGKEDLNGRQSRYKPVSSLVVAVKSWSQLKRSVFVSRNRTPKITRVIPETENFPFHPSFSINKWVFVSLNPYQFHT